MNQKDNQSISACIRESMEAYFRDLDGEPPSNVYEMVVNCVEKPMLDSVLRFAGGNQTRAAEILGINRNTLRKKLKDHGLG